MLAGDGRQREGTGTVVPEHTSKLSIVNKFGTLYANRGWIDKAD